MTEPDLDTLLLAARSGGPRDVRAFLEEARRLVCRWALIWTGSPDAAEDIAQKVLLRVHASLAEYRPGSARGWMYRICRNAFLDWERRRGTDRRFRARLETTRLARQVVEEDGIDPAAGALLLRLMEELSPRQRAVVDLVDLQGHEPSEVAAMLDLAPQTVRVHLSRARRTLRSRYEEADADVTTTPKEVANG